MSVPSKFAERRSRILNTAAGASTAADALQKALYRITEYGPNCNIGEIRANAVRIRQLADELRQASNYMTATADSVLHDMLQ